MQPSPQCQHPSRECIRGLQSPELKQRQTFVFGGYTCAFVIKHHDLHISQELNRTTCKKLRKRRQIYFNDASGSGAKLATVAGFCFSKRYPSRVRM